MLDKLVVYFARDAFGQGVRPPLVSTKIVLLLDPEKVHIMSISQYIQLGSTELKVPPICLGTLTFGSDSDFGDSKAIIDTCLNNNITFFDTADSYNAGTSEEFLGKILKGKRHQVTIASKVGMVVQNGSYTVNLSKKHILKSIDESLHRLQTDYIDLYQAHWPHPATPQEETIDAFDSLHKAGKIRYTGCSNYLGWQCIQAQWISTQNNLVPFSCIQPRYNILDRHAEDEIIPAAIDQSLGIIPYNPIAGGLLSDKYAFDTQPSAGTRFGDQEQYRHRYWYPTNFKAIAEIKEIATKAGFTTEDLSLSWIMNQRGITAPIVGVRNTAQLHAILELLKHPIPHTVTSSLDNIRGIAYDRFSPWRKHNH